MPEQAGGDALQRVGGPHLVAAVGQQEEQAPVGRRVGEEGDEVERRLVGPVQVLEHEHDRCLGAEPADHRERLLEQAQARVGAGAAGECARLVARRAGEQPRQLARTFQLRRARERAQRLDERQVGQARADELDAAADQHGRAAVLRPRRDLADHAALADPGRARDEHGPPVAQGGLAEHRVQRGQLLLAADEAGPGRRPARTGRGRPRRRVELRVLGEDPPVQRLQPRGRLDAQLLVEPAAEAVVGRERLGLPAGAVEREHEQPVRRLAQRVRGDVRLELRDRVGVAAARDVGLDALLEAGQPQRFEVRGLDLRERLLELGERRAAPQVQRLAQQRRRALRVAGVECRAPGLPQPREARGVHVLGAGDERVARRPRLERTLGQDLAQLRDGDLDHLDRRRRDVLAPQVVHEPADRHRCGSGRGRAGRAARAAVDRRVGAAAARQAPRAVRGRGTPSRSRQRYPTRGTRWT